MTAEIDHNIIVMTEEDGEIDPNTPDNNIHVLELNDGKVLNDKHESFADLQQASTTYEKAKFQPIIIENNKLPVVSSVFRKYDSDGDGAVSEADIVKGLTELSQKHKLKLSVETIDEMAKDMFASAHVTNGKMSEEDWATLAANNTRQRVSLAYPEKQANSGFAKYANILYCYRQQIVVLILFYALQALLFGLGIDEYQRDLPTSGREYSAASMVGIAFGLCLRVDCAILILFPAYRWTVTLLRRAFPGLARFFPFDSWIRFHIVLGVTICALTAGHVIAFIISFYEYSLDPVTMAYNLTLGKILTMQGIVGSDYLGFTAVSGWIQLSCLTVIVIFALPPVRNTTCYDAFYWTHKLQHVFWAALIVHEPDFWKYFIGPFALYLIEKLHKYINAMRWSGTTHITQVDLLPLNVTHLSIKRPKDFIYNPGDYAFIKIPEIGQFSWHPFTLSSPPELPDVIWFHIRASGNWTRSLNQYFQQEKYVAMVNRLEKAPSSEYAAQIPLEPIVRTLSSIRNLDIPVLIDGPYGASTTALFDTEHAVLIGAGIGVTPFASILGSALAELSALNCEKCGSHFPAGAPGPALRINRKNLKLKKLDFYWVCREQANIQWFIDLLNGWEKQQEELPSDALFMNCQIYITSIPNNQSKDADGFSLGMDLHWKARKKDAVTGLRTATNTGRPNWPSVFDKIDQNRKGPVRVFYCGPHALEREIRWLSGQYKFQFSWENF